MWQCRSSTSGFRSPLFWIPLPLRAVIAAEVGHVGLAYDYLRETALIDLDDIQHNTRNGLHIASLAGTWIAAVAGFGGMRDHNGILSFRPRLPESLSRLAFRMRFRGRKLLVEVEHGRVTYSLAEGWRWRSSTTAGALRSLPSARSSARSLPEGARGSQPAARPGASAAGTPR